MKKNKLSAPLHDQLPLGLGADVEVLRRVEQVVGLVGHGVVEHGVAQLAPD